MHYNKAIYLSIDQGGHASRVIAFNAAGEPLAHSESPIDTHYPRPDRVEHDARQVLDSISRCLHAVIEKLGDDARYIEGAGLATQRSSIVCWDRHSGEPLSPILSWQDRRGHALLQAMELDREDIHKTTGLFPSAYYGASKMTWCLENLDAVKQAAAGGSLCCAPMASYLIHRLVEQNSYLVDPVNASRTLLWHLHRRDWDEYLLRQFDIPREVLPESVASNHPFGDIVIGEHRIPLSVVSGDQSAALYAHGELQYETAYVNVGTGAFVSRPLGYALRYGRRLLSSIIYADEDGSRYVMEGTVNGAGSAVDWLQKQVPVEDLWERLPGWLAQENKPPLFFNGVSGLAAPYWVTEFETGFSDENAPPREKYVALIESIVFLLFANVQEMMKCASKPQQVQIGGGLSQLDGLCQRLADLSRLPVYRPAQCEATARGTAYLVAGRPNNWPEQRHGDWFEPRDNATLEARFVLWESGMLERMRHND